MNLQDKLKRSKIAEKIDFTKIGCLEQNDPLEKLENSDRIVVEPIWTIDGDTEGKIYADYRKTHPEYDGVYMRPQLINRLKIVAKSLNEKYELVIKAGHRPLEVQKKVFQDCLETYKNNNSGVSHKAALKHARIFVSDPKIELPPHNCGAAVDVDVRDVASGKMLDFGSFVNEDNESSFLYADVITHEQMKNRQILLKAMLGAGFASYFSEWWHFSYGDQVWAWFYGEKDSLYGLVEV